MKYCNLVWTRVVDGQIDQHHQNIIAITRWILIVDRNKLKYG